MPHSQTPFSRSVPQHPRTIVHDTALQSDTSFLVQELKNTLSQTLSQSRELRKTFSGAVGALPDDLLYRILERACVIQAEAVPSPWEHPSAFYGSPGFSSVTARTLSGVCRRWRSLLLSNPLVWSDVRMTVSRPENLSWLGACLDRSASSSAGCTVQIDQPDLVPEVDIANLISEHPHNIRRLKINLRFGRDCDVLALKMEYLERLHIIAGPEISGHDIPNVSHFEKLHTVILENFPTVPHLVFFNITDLTLIKTTTSQRGLFDLFRANQTLEAVRIIHTAVGELPERPLVSLPRLKLLCISHSTPVGVLGVLSPLPDTAQVIIHGFSTDLVHSGIDALRHPFCIFGSENPFRKASISMLPRETSVIFNTDDGASLKVIAQADPADGNHQPALDLFLKTIPGWGPFPDLLSMRLSVERGATPPTSTTLIKTLLPAVPALNRLSFEGNVLCLPLGQALDATRAPNIFGHLKRLDGTLNSDGHIADSIRLLFEALKRRPNMHVVNLNALLREEEVEGVIAEAIPLIEGIKSYGVKRLSFTTTVVV